MKKKDYHSGTPVKLVKIGRGREQEVSSKELKKTKKEARKRRGKCSQAKIEEAPFSLSHKAKAGTRHGKG